jgi:hypothetical protein
MTRRPTKRNVRSRVKAIPARTRLAGLGAVAGLLVLAFLYWSHVSPSAVKDAPALDTNGYVRIDYVVDPHEWGNAKPSLCEIVTRYGLGIDALAATLAANGGTGCASASTRFGANEHVVIAVSADSDFQRCRKQAIETCAAQQPATPAQ